MRQPREIEAPRPPELVGDAGSRPELVEYGPLVLNLDSYQASVGHWPWT